ncbi:biotin-dependent carboxyltransferase family protein [Flagellimonas eckloniae]|uniref:Allophanate hydrolase n=1 Tax=Flagellimonas eckloniae TaxID=346185 RepID=A0A0N8WFK9_9FLAO|nr:biotin-dependent carboxyltransferase family protein [Allomuricauda eckloniae]KQC28987.1 allophanate hydrolase [Allomuricauda eckloniae]
MLKILKSGFFTTIQDAGRFGFRNKGVPISGVMDSISVERINTLLENESSAAVLEITMTGPTLLFEENTYVCLAGALISPTLNNEPVENYKVYKVSSGDILSYGRLEKGFRSYLAVKGGLKTEKILGSYSQYVPLTSKKCISENEEIQYEVCNLFEPKISEVKMDTYLDFDFLEVQRGPEFNILTDNHLEALFSKDFTISKKNNRMAYQLDEKIEGHSYSMLTSATLPGTVQLTPAGKLIVLMKDGQTTGGYPRILQLSETSICVLAQKKFGDFINFKLT